jgi:hypothetical protein
VLELIHPLQGVAACPLNEEQNRSIMMARPGVDYAQTDGRTGLDLDLDPV